MTIIIKDICKSYDGKCVFEKISGKINQKDKIGIVGVNGVGKTTLLNIILGIEDKDSGKISFIPQDLKIEYLSQEPAFAKVSTVYEELYKSGVSIIKYNYNKQKYENKIKKLLGEVGLSEKNVNQKVSSLSGGEKTKLALCKVVLQNLDVLFLDEPTNHFDMDTIKWLENFINRIDKTVVIISHDREFLDNTVNKIFHLTYNGIKEYKGNYTQYKGQRENEIKNKEREYYKQQSEIKHLNQIINDRKTWYNKAHKNAGQNDFARSKAKKHVSVIHAKEKQLERLENNKVLKPKDDMCAAFEVLNKKCDNKNKIPKYLIEVSNIKKSFDKKILFDKVSFRIKKNDKVALIGKNGSGKSTLLKMLLKQENVDDGKIYITPSLKISYFSQELEEIDFENTILDEVLKQSVDVNNARLILACFLFKNEQVYKKIKVLSMGEKCRVAFVKLILSKSDMLILDEPTNYMDIVSREKVEDMIEMFNGTVIVVSHDRYFVKKVSNRIFEIEKGKINIYDGDYKYYVQKKIQNKKKKSTGKNIVNILDEIRRLECNIAFMSGRLDDDKIREEEKNELNTKFIETARKINEYKKMIK